MSPVVVENLRLKELILVVNKNKPFFDEFLRFLSEHGYESIADFIAQDDGPEVERIITAYFKHTFRACLYDGIARPYPPSKSQWYFITWLLRDAPQQRLQPIVSSLEGMTLPQRRLWVLSQIKKFVNPLLPDPESWEWPAIAEVMLQRLEGSRRALKGNLFEAIVRTQLKDLFGRHKLDLRVTPNEVKLNDETYDVEVLGKTEKILLPVKTRETMGGGHALLFTRDIHKSISVARENGFNCIPVVIAESWSGKLDGLKCDHYIHLALNPNQVDKINPLLCRAFEDLVDIFSSLQ